MRTTLPLMFLAATGVVLAATDDPGAGAPQWGTDGLPVTDVELWTDLTPALADGAGGVWVPLATHPPYVQHLDSEGQRTLGTTGAILSGASVEVFGGPYVVPDGTGGVIAGWLETRSGWNSRVFVQRLDAGGNRLWDAGGGDMDGIALTTADAWHSTSHVRMASDGAGGAVLSWGWGGQTLRVQRVNSAGVPQWDTFGNTLLVAAGSLWDSQIVADGTGGAIVAWSDGAEFDPNRSVFATRVDGTGVRPAGWPAAGTVLSGAGGPTNRVSILSDGAGGAFVTWIDARSVTDDPPLYGHRVLADGSLPWGVTNGRLLASRTSNGDAAALAPDGAGGFIATWQVGSGDGNDTQVVAQRFDADGSPLWNAGTPVVVCTDPSTQKEARIVASGAGGAIVVWTDLRGAAWGSSDGTVRAQRLGPDGSLLWGAAADGVILSGDPAGAPSRPVAVGDAADGAIVVWRGFEGSQQVTYAQRVADATGPGPVSQFLLVRKVVGTPNAKKPSKSRWTLSATLDTGGDPAAFASAAHLEIGGYVRDVSLVADRKGVLRYRGGGLDVAVAPSSVGSSKCALTVKVTGADALPLAQDGLLMVGLRCGDVDTGGSCVLARHRYAIGGALPERPVLVSAAKATIGGAGKDSFEASFVFTPAGHVPTPGDVEFAFGSTYRAVVLQGAFRKSGHVFRAPGRPGKAPAMVLDFTRGVATVSGSKMDLGPFAQGAQSVTITLGPVGESTTTAIRMVRKGRALRY